MLADIDGDGSPDYISISGSTLCYRLNTKNGFAAEEKISLEEIKFKVRLYIFNPFCFGKLINLIKKLYIKEFHEDIKQFYGLVNLKKFQQHLNDLNLNINILPPKEKIMPEEINNKSSTNIPLKENTSKENIENPNKITIDNNNNSLSENNSSKEKKKYQKRRQIK